MLTNAKKTKICIYVCILCKALGGDRPGLRHFENFSFYCLDFSPRSEVSARQGDQIGPIFANWIIV
jgi:hypothetical protein